MNDVPVPPRFAERWLGRIVPDDTMVGDLHEEWLQYHAAYGDAAARRWYLRHAAALAARFLVLRVVARSHPPVHFTTRSSRMESFVSDLRQALRAVRRQPAFSALIVLILALGIGINATMFGIADHLLFRPPAYLGQPATTGRVYFSEVYRNQRHPFSVVSYPVYTAVRDRTTTLGVVAAYATDASVVTLNGEVLRLPVTGASASFWSLFDMHPRLGRFFTPDDDRLPSGRNVAVLGYAAWRSRFGGSIQVIGQQLRIDNTLYTIIGVAPSGFTGMELSSSMAYIPITAYGFHSLAPDYATRSGTTWLEIAARPRPAMRAVAIDNDLALAFQAARRAQYAPKMLQQAGPRAMLGSAIHGRGPLADSAVPVTSWLLGVSIALVVLACANVANLLLSRAVGRQREYALRMALGSGRWRLANSVLLETLLLALTAGAAGLIASYWVGRAVEGMLLPDALNADGPSIDGRTALFAMAVAVVVGVLAGLVPLRHAVRRDIGTALRIGDRGATGSRSTLRAGLVVLQVTMSVLLLTGAGLFVRSFAVASHIDLGYDPDHVELVNPDFSATNMTLDQREGVVAALVERARQIPGVVAAARATTVPFLRNSYDPFFLPERDSVPYAGSYAINVVSQNYFTAMGIKLVDGRGFTDADHAASPREIIVSASMARALWPGRRAVGQCIRLLADTMPCSQVTGIAQDVRRGDFGSEQRLQYYVPWAQYPHAPGIIHLRVTDPRVATTEVVRRALQGQAPAQVFLRVTHFREQIDAQMASWRLGATMFAIFGALAVILVAAGLLGVLGHDVAQQAREFGIRMALGATPSEIRRRVIRRGVLLVLSGLGLGLVLAALGTPRMQGLLFRVSPHDLITSVGVAGVLLTIALAATAIPAWRATRMDLHDIMRND